MTRNTDRIPRMLLKAEVVCQEEEWSIGELVAELAGDGSTSSQDPFHVEDDVFEGRLDMQLPEQVTLEDGRNRETFDAVEEYWKQSPDLRFCQLVCNVHSQQYDSPVDSVPENSPYPEPISELMNRQLVETLS